MANETILVVDGDTRSRKVLEVSFKKSGYRVSITKTIDEALESLQRDTPDLIISDTDLPDGDGFEFCKQVKSRSEFEHIPFLFLTEEAALPSKIEGLEIGADDYLTRPIYIKEVTTRVEALLQKRDRELLSEEGVEEFTGELSEITLIDLLQTIDEEERTGRIDFEREDRRGTMTFRDGRVIDARCGKLQGEAAVYRLMLWPNGTFVVTYQEEVRGAPHIDRTTDELLIQGIQQLQQWDRLIEDLPSLDRVFETDYRELPELLDSVPEEVGRIVRLFDGFRTLREVIDDSPVDDVTSLRIIRRIFEEEVLEDITAEADRESTSQARSHLADWLEQGESDLEEESDFDEHEENTSPGYPGGAGGQADEDVETDQLDHENLAAALADELDESRADEERAGGTVEEDTDAGTTSGRRYQPAGDSDGEGAPRADGDEIEDPASIDETLEELEQAERLRRQEEAKRLVEQQKEVSATDESPGEESAEEAGDSAELDPDDTAQELEADELRRVEEQGVPRIPGATRTRDSAPQEVDTEGLADTVEVDRAEPEAESTVDSASPHPGEPASGEWETDEEETDATDASPRRAREDTPRARPTTEAPVTDGGNDTSPAETGDVAPEDGDGDAGVPVSFRTVDGPPSETAESPEEDASEIEDSPDEDNGRTSAERRAVSVDEAESVQDEASASVRESARKALEEAAAAAEPESADDADATESGESDPQAPEEGVPFGSPSDSQLAEGDQSPFEGREDVSEEDVPEEEVPESLEEVERVSNNGEVVRTEYDLSKSEAAEQPVDESRETPEESADDSGPTRTPEAGAGGAERADEAGGESADDEEFERGLEWDDEPTARKIEPATAPTETVEPDEGEEPDEETAASAESTETSDDEDDEADVSSETIEKASSTPTDEWAGGSIEPPTDSADASGETPAAAESQESDDESESAASGETEVGKETVDAGTSGDTNIGMSEAKATTTDEGFGEEVDSLADRAERETTDEPADDDESAADEASDLDGETATQEETPVAKEEGADDDADDAEEAGADALSDSSSEMSFFEQGGEESQEEYDWDFEDDLDQEPSHTWRYVAAVAALGIAVVGGAWGMELGPFATSEGGGGASDEGGGEAVASSETPTDEKGSSVAPGDQTKEDDEKQVESPEARGSDQLQAFAEKTATSVSGTAEKTAMVLGGEDPYATDEKSEEATEKTSGKEKDDAAREGDEASPARSEAGGPEEAETGGEPQETAQSSGSASGGGGLGGQIAEARQLINSKQYSAARSKLEELQQQAPNSSRVARLYLDMASNLQIDKRKQEAKQAYRSYLEMRPDGSRAEEVRSILNRL